MPILNGSSPLPSKVSTGEKHFTHTGTLIVNNQYPLKPSKACPTLRLSKSLNLIRSNHKQPTSVHLDHHLQKTDTNNQLTPHQKAKKDPKVNKPGHQEQNNHTSSASQQRLRSSKSSKISRQDCSMTPEALELHFIDKTVRLHLINEISEHINLKLISGDDTSDNALQLKKDLSLVVRYLKNSPPADDLSWKAPIESLNSGKKELAVYLFNIGLPNRKERLNNLSNALTTITNDVPLNDSVRHELDFIKSSLLITLDGPGSQQHQTYFDIQKIALLAKDSLLRQSSRLDIKPDWKCINIRNPIKKLLPALLLAKAVSGGSTSGSRDFIISAIKDFSNQSDKALTQHEKHQLQALISQLDINNQVATLKSNQINSDSKSALIQAIQANHGMKTAFSIHSDRHAMVLQVESRAKDDKLIITIHNSNGETFHTQFHDNDSSDLHLKQKITTKLSVDATDFIKRFGSDRLASTIITAINDNSTSSLTSMLTRIGKIDYANPTELTRSQKIGDCSTDALLAFIKNELPDINLYRKIKTHLLKMSITIIDHSTDKDIVDFIKTLVNKNQDRGEPLRFARYLTDEDRNSVIDIYNYHNQLENIQTYIDPTLGKLVEIPNTKNPNDHNGTHQSDTEDKLLAAIDHYCNMAKHELSRRIQSNESRIILY